MYIIGAIITAVFVQLLIIGIRYYMFGWRKSYRTLLSLPLTVIISIIWPGLVLVLVIFSIVIICNVLLSVIGTGIKYTFDDNMNLSGFFNTAKKDIIRNFNKKLGPHPTRSL